MTDLSRWVEFIDNPTVAEAEIIGRLSVEIPSVTLRLTGGQERSLVYLHGFQHDVRWFLHLFEQEAARLKLNV